MPAYNFKECFAADVKSGKKRQTIRKERKRRTKPGDPLYLYTGMRTIYCRKLRFTVCRAVKHIDIGDIVVGAAQGITVDDKAMLSGSRAADAFAICDGFSGSGEMIEWFRAAYGLPFRGVVIYW